MKQIHKDILGGIALYEWEHKSEGIPNDMDLITEYTNKWCSLPKELKIEILLALQTSRVEENEQQA